MCIKGQGYSLTLAKGHSDFKINKNLFFSETVDIVETKFHIEASGRIKLNIYTKKLGHMAKMAAMHIYGKNL